MKSYLLRIFRRYVELESLVLSSGEISALTKLIDLHHFESSSFLFGVLIFVFNFVILICI